MRKRKKRRTVESAPDLNRLQERINRVAEEVAKLRKNRDDNEWTLEKPDDT